MKSSWLLAALWSTVLSLGLCAGAWAAGEPAKPAAVPDNVEVVKIQQWSCKLGQCGWGLWSGTMIGEASPGQVLVLTCAHEYDPAKPVKVQIVWPDRLGEAVEGRILKLDPSRDLGLVTFPRGPERLRIMRIAAAAPAVGAELRTIGWGGGKFTNRPVKLVKERLGASGQPAEFEVLPSIEEGDSGGALIANADLVGVCVRRDVLRPVILPRQTPTGNPVRWINATKEAMNEPAENAPMAGYCISHRQVCQFLQDAGYAEIAAGNPRSSRQPIDVTDPRGPQPGPAPDPPEVVERPAEKPYRRETVEDRPEPPPEPTAADWKGVKFVVLIPRQPGLDSVDLVVRSIEKLSASERGPGAAVRRKLQEWTAKNVDIELLYERIEPKRFRAFVEATGCKVGSYASVFALVEQRLEGIKGKLLSISIGWAEQRARAKLDEVPFDWCLERTSPDEYGDAVAALAVEEDAVTPDEPSGAGKPVVAKDPAAEDSGDWQTHGVLGLLYGVAAGLRKWLEGWRHKA